MKIIRVTRDVTEADKVIALAKTLPGFKSANKYRVSGRVHVLVSGDFTRAQEDTILEGHRNLAK